MKLLGLFLLVWGSVVVGYSQNQPLQLIYRQSQPAYTLDSIRSTPTSMIFCCSFISHNKRSGGLNFNTRPEKGFWLYDKNSSASYPMKGIYNLRSNGKLVSAHVVGDMTASPSRTGSYTHFSFDVHFDSPPAELQQAHLIEGQGKLYDERHFNFYDIWIPPHQPNVEGWGKTIAQPINHPAQFSCNTLLLLSSLRYEPSTTDYSDPITCQFWVQQLAAYLKKHPETTLELHLHNATYDSKMNEILSRMRTKALARHLVREGIAVERLSLHWYGAERLLYPADSPLNQRVEIRLTCP